MDMPIDFNTHNGEINKIQPLFDVGSVRDVGCHPLLCVGRKHTVDNKDVIYDFLMITDKKNLTDTNLFKDENCYILKKSNNNCLLFDSAVICSLTYQIKESDIKSGKFNVAKNVKSSNGEDVVVNDFDLANVTDLMYAIRDREEHAIGVIDPTKDKITITSIGKDYLKNYYKIDKNIQQIKPLQNEKEKTRYNNIKKEMDSFFKHQNINLKTEIEHNR